MLRQLYIQNVAVIEKTAVELTSGLNVFTGETGAGKSILIDSIHAVLGGRVSREMVRTGASKALVSALFSDLSVRQREILEQNGYEPEEDGTLLFTREIAADGKSSARINGRPATVSILRLVGEGLLNIHGQHDSQALLSPERHLEFIDAFGGHQQELADYAAVYRQLQQAERDIRALTMDEADKARRLDLLGYQIQELEQAGLQPGEEEELTAQKKVIQDSEKLAQLLQQIQDNANGTDEYEGALGFLRQLAEDAGQVSQYFPQLERNASRMEEMYYELQESVGDFGEYLAGLDFDPRQLEEIEDRLDLLHRLERKYGDSVEMMQAFLERARREFDQITFADERLEQLKRKREELSRRGQRGGKGPVSPATGDSPGVFPPGLPGTPLFGHAQRDLEVQRSVPEEGREPLTERGMDRMEFAVSVNLGEPPKPIAKVASGGELSRIMLSLKNVLADRDEVPTLIFDEVDTGVSGRAARRSEESLNRHPGAVRSSVSPTWPKWQPLATVITSSKSRLRTTAPLPRCSVWTANSVCRNWLESWAESGLPLPSCKMPGRCWKMQPGSKPAFRPSAEPSPF